MDFVRQNFVPNIKWPKREIIMVIKNKKPGIANNSIQHNKLGT